MITTVASGLSSADNIRAVGLELAFITVRLSSETRIVSLAIAALVNERRGLLGCTSAAGRN